MRGFIDDPFFCSLRILTVLSVLKFMNEREAGKFLSLEQHLPCLNKFIASLCFTIMFIAFILTLIPSFSSGMAIIKQVGFVPFSMFASRVLSLSLFSRLLQLQVQRAVCSSKQLPSLYSARQPSIGLA